MFGGLTSLYVKATSKGSVLVIWCKFPRRTRLLYQNDRQAKNSTYQHDRKLLNCDVTSGKS